jgi:hypothetical protein
MEVAPLEEVASRMRQPASFRPPNASSARKMEKTAAEAGSIR